MNNPLLEELKIVQNDYLTLLKGLDKVPENEISLAMIDSVNVFWYEKRNVVKLVFEYLFKGKDTYCFSAATIFDVDDKDQYSFFLLGDYHVFDDPIPSYLNTLNATSNELYLTKMKEIISNTIKDNIRIIEELENDLIILPLRHSSEILNQHYEDLDEIAENIFCNLFEDITNIEEYMTKVVTIEDLVDHLDPHNAESILLFDGDNPSETWDYRIQKYKEENNHFDMSSFSIGDIFLFALFSHLRQALSLIDMTSNFEVIPFIRSFIPFHYYILLSSIIEQNSKPELRLEHMEQSSRKTTVSYFLYREFSKREIKYPIGELKQRADRIEFEDKMFSELESSVDKQEISTIISVVHKYLDKLENS